MIRCVNRQCAVQKRTKNMRQAAAFCLFMGTSPINFGLLGGNGNTLKFEMITKLKDKQTSIATVRDLLQTFATFPAPPFFSLQTTFKGVNTELRTGGKKEIFLNYANGSSLSNFHTQNFSYVHSTLKLTCRVCALNVLSILTLQIEVFS
jgi:hypothetical protein